VRTRVTARTHTRTYTHRRARRSLTQSGDARVHTHAHARAAGPNTAACPPLRRLPEKLLAGARARILEEGFTHVPSSKLAWRASLPDLAAAVVTLMQHGWPPSFLLLYDEAWAMQAQAGALLGGCCGGNAPNCDTLVWFVDPSNGDAGFSPHRDRQPDDVPGSFRADGTPRYATAWVPFTDAAPDNSCLYLIPRAGDPGCARMRSEACSARVFLLALLILVWCR
jgi:hypothetical protein